MANPTQRDNQKTLLVKKLAEKHKVSKAYVYMVIAGDRVNESILSDYMMLDEAYELLAKNMLAPCVPQIISYKNSKPTALETIGRN